MVSKKRKADDLKRAANKPGQKRVQFGLQNSHHRVMLGTSIIRHANLSKSFFGHLMMETQKSSLHSLLLMIQLSKKLFFSLQLSELQKMSYSKLMLVLLNLNASLHNLHLLMTIESQTTLSVLNQLPTTSEMLLIPSSLAFRS